MQERGKCSPTKPDENWVHDATAASPQRVAETACADQGRLYDWQAVVRFIFWVLPAKLSRGMCSDTVAEWLGAPKEDAYLFDPRSLRVAVRYLK